METAPSANAPRRCYHCPRSRCKVYSISAAGSLAVGRCYIPQGDIAPPRALCPRALVALPRSRRCLPLPLSPARARQHSYSPRFALPPPVVARARGAACGALWMRLRPRAPGLVAAGQDLHRYSLAAQLTTARLFCTLSGHEIIPAVARQSKPNDIAHAHARAHTAHDGSMQRGVYPTPNAVWYGTHTYLPFFARYLTLVYHI